VAITVKQELGCPTCGNIPQDGARPAIQFGPSELGGQIVAITLSGAGAWLSDLLQ